MATSFPNALDAFNNPVSDSLLNQPSVDHSTLHTNINDAVEAIQTRIGIEGTTDNNSLEYRLNLVESISGTSVLIQETAADWADTNPILHVYQIGVEQDTLKMKFGDGRNWNDIGYSNVTPSQLGNNLDLYIPVGDRGNVNGVASLDQNGLIPDSEIPSSITRDSELSDHISDTTNIHGITNTADLATKTYADDAAAAIGQTASSNLTSHQNDTTNIHGITDTSVLITTSGGTVQNLTVTGNLTVQGTSTTVNSTNLEVTDSLVYLASQQFDTDVLDIGIFGAYGDEQSGHLHTGLIRDASDKKWKLISNGSEPTTSEVDFSAVSYDTLKLGTLEATSASIGNVSNTELSYLDGVTSAIQTQIDSKQAIVSGVSDTEIGYLDGVTSSIQAQIDTKVSSLVQFNQQSSSYTLQLSDKDKVIEMSNGGTLTIPAEATINFPNGFSVEILQTGTSQVTIAGSGFTPNATPGLKLRAQWSSATLIKRGSNLWVVTGDLSV